ncbi:MAG: hypothetical protein V5788_02975 [Shewanella sp.]
MLKKSIKSMSLVVGLTMLTQSAPIAALNLDTLFLSSNKNGNGIFTASNSTQAKEYIKVTVVKVDVQGNKLIKTPLTRDNFLEWDLVVNPAKTMLQPGESKNFAVKYLCKEDCFRETDSLYQVRFVPTAPPGDKEGTHVSIRFGMAPYYVIPATEQHVEYSLDINDDTHSVTIDNTGNTFLKVEFNACNVLLMDNKNCRAVYQILAGRSRTIDLPDSMAGKNVKVTVANHDQSIQEIFTL